MTKPEAEVLAAARKWLEADKWRARCLVTSNQLWSEIQTDDSADAEAFECLLRANVAALARFNEANRIHVAAATTANRTLLTLQAAVRRLEAGK